MELKERIKFGWFVEEKAASPGRATRQPRWSSEPKSYEQHLEDEIHGMILVEGATPAGFASECMDPGHERWQEAWDLYYEWVEHQWRKVAMAHAGRPLTDDEFLRLYGRWQDRGKFPGKELDALVEFRRRPGFGWLH